MSTSLTASRWDRKTFQADGDTPEMVERKVNKLTMEKFDSISDQIISWANKSESEKDGRTLIQVIKLVFEKATDEATWSEMYARLGRKMMEQISPKVQDDRIKTTTESPLLVDCCSANRCQSAVGWRKKRLQLQLQRKQWSCKGRQREEGRSEGRTRFVF
jgi:translation initiation factor 4G